MEATGTADHLAWEARRGRPAGIAAILAAVLTLVGAVWGGVLFSDVPSGGALEALERAAEPGPVGELESLRVAVYEFYDDKAVGVLITTLMRAFGYLGMGWALVYLAIAVRARRPELPRILQYLPVVGAVLSAIATVLSTVATIVAVRDFLDGPRTIDEADTITQNGLLVTAQLVNLPGLLALALGIVLISLHAMRAGMITRFMGVLGMITGALLVFPLGSPLPIVQCFWLFMLGLLFLGRWPGGTPPAWSSGEAMPWPSGARMRQDRARAAEHDEPESDPRDDGVPTRSGSARKKRKRRA